MAHHSGEANISQTHGYSTCTRPAEVRANPLEAPPLTRSRPLILFGQCSTPRPSSPSSGVTSIEDETLSTVPLQDALADARGSEEAGTSPLRQHLTTIVAASAKDEYEPRSASTSNAVFPSASFSRNPFEEPPSLATAPTSKSGCQVEVHTDAKLVVTSQTYAIRVRSSDTEHVVTCEE